MKIKKGDSVKILLGKDRGRSGKVTRVFGKDSKVLVEGINVYKRHVKKMKGMEGGIIDIEKPINISNVALICPNCKKETRVGFKISNKDKIRVCKKCGQAIIEKENKK